MHDPNVSESTVQEWPTLSQTQADAKQKIEEVGRKCDRKYRRSNIKENSIKNKSSPRQLRLAGVVRSQTAPPEFKVGYSRASACCTKIKCIVETILQEENIPPHNVRLHYISSIDPAA